MNTHEATGLNLRQLINILRRRWRLTIISVGIAVGLAGTIWLFFAPRYTATAQIIVDPPRGSSGAGSPAMLGCLMMPPFRPMSLRSSPKAISSVCLTALSQTVDLSRKRSEAYLVSKNFLSTRLRPESTRSRTLARE